MMATLDPEQRTSSFIISLWNTLGEEEKAQRAEESAQEMSNYLALLAAWQKGQ